MTGPVSPLRSMRASMLGVTGVALSAIGHVAGGGHFEPVLLLLLATGVSLAAYGWLRRERGLFAICLAVLTVQVISHLVLSAGHLGQPESSMVLTHLGAAVLLAVFLRLGEARIFAWARRNYLRLLLAGRLAAAGGTAFPGRPAVARYPRSLRTDRAPGHVEGRGPPVRAV